VHFAGGDIEIDAVQRDGGGAETFGEAF